MSRDTSGRILPDRRVLRDYLTLTPKARVQTDLYVPSLEGRVYLHEIVKLEVSLHGLKPAQQEALDDLPVVLAATPADVERHLSFFVRKGVGYVDSNIIIQAVHHDCVIWTMDAKLGKLARTFARYFHGQHLPRAHNPR